MFQYSKGSLNPLHIQENCVIIDHFIQTQGKKHISIQEGVTHCEYFYIGEKSSLDLEIVVTASNVHLQIYGLIFGQGESSHCHTTLLTQANSIQANMHLISIVQESSQIEHRGTITIPSNFHQIETHLLEEHVML